MAVRGDLAGDPRHRAFEPAARRLADRIERRAIAALSSNRPEQWSATSQPAATTARARSASGPDSAAMRDIVRHQQAFEADAAADHSSMTVGDRLAQRSASQAG